VGTIVAFVESILLVLTLKKILVMKKTILSWLLISSSFMVFAQIDTTRQAMDTTRRDTTNMYNSTNAPRNTDTTGVHNKMNANVSSNAYNAYGAKSVTIPYRAQLNLSKDYPMAANANIAWTQSGEWYHGTYMNNGRYSHIYYDDRGNTWTVALPVTESYVPDDIVSKATTMFGPAIYDLTTLKGDSAHPSIYQIRTIDNGQVKAQWIGDDGSSIMDPFRSDVEVNMNTSTNAAKDNSNVDSARANSMDSMNNMNNMNRNNMNNMNRNNMNNNMNRNNMDSSNRMNNSMDSMNRNNMNNNMYRNNRNMNRSMDSSNRMNNSMDSSGNNMNRNMHNMDSTNRNMMDSTRSNMDSTRHNMDSTDHMNSMNANPSDSTMNNSADSTRNSADGAKMKIKTKNSDGKETKVKVKDGQLKTKED
jgi:hypothetical protein